MQRVQLHVYDLSQGLARQLSLPMMGVHIDAVYHTGIVAFGKEWFLYAQHFDTYKNETWNFR